MNKQGIFDLIMGGNVDADAGVDIVDIFGDGQRDAGIVFVMEHTGFIYRAFLDKLNLVKFVYGVLGSSQFYYFPSCLKK